MATTNTIKKVFETVLSIPGMNENVKIQLALPRKNALLLSKIIERGLAVKSINEEEDILSIASKQTLEELNQIAGELLNKAGLVEMNEKLKLFEK